MLRPGIIAFSPLPPAVRLAEAQPPFNCRTTSASTVKVAVS